MTFLEGDHLDEMLKKEPDQNIKNNYGQIMWNFFHENINSSNNTFHADVHPGNFLFCEGGKLGVIDFGCIKVFPDLFIKSCIRVVQKHLNKDLEIEGVLITMYDHRLNLSRQVVQELQEYLNQPYDLFA